MTFVDDDARGIILDHNRHPRGFAPLTAGAAILSNPSCGDRLRLALRQSADGCVDFAFDGVGCSISVASASMMTEILSGMEKEKAIEVVNTVVGALRGEYPVSALSQFGDVSALAGIASLPVRVKCATLAWQGALDLLLAG